MPENLRKRFLVVAALLLAGLLALWLPWEHEDPHEHPTPAHPESSGTPPSPSSVDPIGRAGTPDEAPPERLVNWRDSMDLRGEFMNRFNACFITNGGQDAMAEYVLDRTKATKNDASGTRLQESIEKLEASNLTVKEVSASLYTELVYGGYFIAGNFLSNNVRWYNQWVAEREKPEYALPVHRMLRQPMDYPPEMIVSYWTGSTDEVDIPEDLVSRLAHLRDTFILQYCHCYQEGFMMEPCLNQIVKELGIVISDTERSEAFSALLPEFDSINRALETSKQGYFLGVRSLMASAGMPVIEIQ